MEKGEGGVGSAPRSLAHAARLHSLHSQDELVALLDRMVAEEALLVEGGVYRKRA